MEKAEYIDRRSLLRRLPQDLPYKASVKRVLEQAPCEDVAPIREVVSEFVKRFEKHISNCKFTLGQTNDIQYALKKAAEEIKKKYTETD